MKAAKDQQVTGDQQVVMASLETQVNVDLMESLAFEDLLEAMDLQETVDQLVNKVQKVERENLAQTEGKELMVLLVALDLKVNKAHLEKMEGTGSVDLRAQRAQEELLAILDKREE